MHAVSNLLISIKVRKTYRVTLFSFPDQEWEWSTDIDDKNPVVHLFNGSLGISKYFKQDGTELPSEGSLLPLIVEPIPYLLETQLAQPIPVSVSRRNFGKSLLDMVRTRFRDDEIEFVVDPNSLMVVMEIFWSKKYHNAVEPWRIICFYDYAQIDGIMLPQKFDVRDVPEGRNIFDIEKYRKHPITLHVNVQYRDKLFEYPPPVSEGPEAWKPKQL